MADHSLPTVEALYADFVAQMNARFADLVKALDPANTSATNVPVNAIRWNSANGYDEKYDGTTWVRLQTAANARVALGLGNVNNTADADKPVSTAQATALAGKQATLVSGTNLKTINSTSLLGSGDVTVQPPLVSGTNIKTVNGTSILGSGDIAISSGVTSVNGATGAVTITAAGLGAVSTNAGVWGIGVVLAARVENTTVTSGSTVAGSNVRPYHNAGGPYPSGTWRNISQAICNSSTAQLFQRIS